MTILLVAFAAFLTILFLLQRLKSGNWLQLTAGADEILQGAHKTGEKEPDRTSGNRLDQIVRFVFGVNYKNPELSDRRAGFVYLFIFAFTALSPLFVKLPVWQNEWISLGGIAVFYAGAGALILGLRWSKKATAICNLFSIWFVLCVSFHPIMTGDVQYWPLLTLIVVPMIMGIVSGVGSCAIGGACVIVSYSGVALGGQALSGVDGSQNPSMLAYAGISTIIACLVQTYFWSSIKIQNEALTKTAKKMRSQALNDALTECGNRRAFQQHVDRLLAQSDRTAKTAMVIIDLDRFKQINDTFGHEAGDKVLKVFAKRLRSIVRENGRVFRLGGDEFVVILSNATSSMALETLCHKIVSASDTAVEYCSANLDFDVSLGAALSDASKKGAHRLYQQADAALFEAKKKLGSNYIVFNSTLSSAAIRRHEIEACLKMAIRQRSIKIAMQPQVNLETGETVSFEALARWHDPLLGNVSPSEFIPIAEQSALITVLDRVVISLALNAAGSWIAPHQKVCINVSARSLSSPKFSPYVIEQIRRCGLQPSQVEIEITETALIENWESSKLTVNALREQGIRIALDDFGVGYSSLSYLLEFPIQKIKFDRSFLSHETKDEKAIVLQSMVELAKKMNLEVVAEGVETKEQLELLRQVGCLTGQGYFLGKPIEREHVIVVEPDKRSA